MDCKHKIAVSTGELDIEFMYDIDEELRTYMEWFNAWKWSKHTLMRRVRAIELQSHMERLKENWKFFKYCPDCGENVEDMHGQILF